MVKDMETVVDYIDQVLCNITNEEKISKEQESALLFDALVSVWMLRMAMGLCLSARMSTTSPSGKGHFRGGGRHVFEFLRGLRTPKPRKHLANTSAMDSTRRELSNAVVKS